MLCSAMKASQSVWELNWLAAYSEGRVRGGGRTLPSLAVCLRHEARNRKSFSQLTPDPDLSVVPGAIFVVLKIERGWF